MKRWLTIILLLVWVGVAGAQTTPPMCSITGNVANADGSPYVGVIKFYNPVVQIINNIPINPLQVSTGTTPTGVINPISLPQAAFFQVTMCPSQSAASGCAATFTAIVPAAPTANFGNMAMGTNLINPSIITSSLSVSGTTSLSGTTTFADGSTVTTGGFGNMKTLGIGAPAPTVTGGMLGIVNNGNYNTVAQITNNSNGANASTTWYLVNNVPHYASFQLVSSAYTAQGGLVPGDSMVLQTSGAGGLELMTTNSGPIRFDVNGSNLGTFNPTNFTLFTPQMSQPGPTTSSNYDVANNKVTVANGANVALPPCSGVVILNEPTISATTCMWLTGGGYVTLASQTNTYCTTGTTPAAGKYSIGYNGSTTYAIYNNLGGSTSFAVMNICMREYP